jgi:hypothetical protein
MVLKLHSDGTGRISMKEGKDGQEFELLADSFISSNQMAQFFSHLDSARFWEQSTESPNHGFDGAEWILEGTENGRYHIVVRWCPNLRKHTEDEALASAACELSAIAGHPLKECR